MTDKTRLPIIEVEIRESENFMQPLIFKVIKFRVNSKKRPKAQDFIIRKPIK